MSKEQYNHNTTLEATESKRKRDTLVGAVAGMAALAGVIFASQNGADAENRECNPAIDVCQDDVVQGPNTEPGVTLPPEADAPTGGPQPGDTIVYDPVFDEKNTETTITPETTVPVETTTTTVVTSVPNDPELPPITVDVPRNPQDSN